MLNQQSSLGMRKFFLFYAWSALILEYFKKKFPEKYKKFFSGYNFFNFAFGIGQVVPVSTTGKGSEFSLKTLKFFSRVSLSNTIIMKYNN